MNDATNQPTSPRSGFADQMAAVADWGPERLWGVVRRRRYVLLAGLLAGIALAAVYLVVAVPSYTAEVNILLDTPKVRAVADAYDVASIGFETGGVDSQVELLRSQRVALGVVKKLDLKNSPRFRSERSAIFGWVKSGVDRVRDLLGLREPGADRAASIENERLLEQRIVGSLIAGLQIRRIGRTYVIQLRYTSTDPGFAAKIANAFADQYLTDQLDAKYDATTRAAVWLQDRINELRNRSLTADAKVQQFRADNGLIAVDGKLVSDQQLAAANTQLSEARATLAEAEARAQRIETITREGSVDAAVTESLANPVVAQLRTRYLEASKRESEISKKLGADHVAAANLRNEMKQYERLLFEELGRIGETYRSEHQIARNRLAALEQNLSSMLQQTAGNNETLVQLRELERESETYKQLYTVFLTRYQEALQQQSFPINDARVITAATPPQIRSWPRTNLIFGLGLLAGGLLGVGASVVFEYRDRVFRTGEQVQAELGVEFLGLLPRLDVDNRRPAGAGETPGVLGPVAPTLRYTATAPLSGFAETLRATKVSADIALRGKRPKIIGVVSVLPGEGKTLVSKNLASLTASFGAPTLLVDTDLRNPGLTRSVAPNVEAGIVELLRGERRLDELLLHERDTGLAMLPAVVHRKMVNSSDLLSSEAMRSFLAGLEGTYDYVVLDLPPIGPVIDVRAAAELIDAFVFVVEWGETQRSLVRSTLASEEAVMRKCLGVVLNKVDNARMALYDRSTYRNYYYSSYSKYYTGG